MIELILIALNIALYFSIINNGLVVDDVEWYAGVGSTLPKIKDIRNIKQLKNFIQVRLYGGTTFSNNIKLEHCVSIFINAFISILIYKAFGSSTVSATAAVLYSCNPINNQSSTWLNGRRYAVNIILVLLGMISGPLGILLYLLTPIFQATPIFMPILFLKYPNIMVIFIPVIILTGLFFRKELIAKIKHRLSGLLSKDMIEFSPKRFIIITKIYGFYFFKMLFPQRVLMFYPTIFYWGITEKGNEDAYEFNNDLLKGVIALGISIYGVSYFHGDNLLFWCFMVCSILMWCGFFPIVQTIADRYVSLANVFMMYFLAYFICQLPSIEATMLLVSISCWYTFWLFESFKMYKDIESFYNYNMKYAHGLFQPRAEKISQLMKKGDVMSAAQCVQEGLIQNAKDYTMLLYASMIAVMMGNKNNAEVFLNEAEKNKYLYQEERQQKEIDGLRFQMSKIKRVFHNPKIIGKKQ